MEKPGAGEKGGKIGCGWKGRENTEQLCQNGRESWETRRRLQVANSSIKKIKQWETCSKICYDAKAKCSSMCNPLRRIYTNMYSPRKVGKWQTRSRMISKGDWRLIRRKAIEMLQVNCILLYRMFYAFYSYYAFGCHDWTTCSRWETLRGSMKLTKDTCHGTCYSEIRKSGIL